MMTAAAVVVACAMSLIPSIQSNEPDPSTATQEYHLRPLDPLVQEWFRIGEANSRTFGALLERLAASDVIVHVVLVDQIKGGAQGQLLFATSTATARFLRIELRSGGTTTEMVALLAHELQHAVEVANAPYVRNSQAMATLYLRPGDQSARYDSAEARQMGERVSGELAARTSFGQTIR